LLEFETYKEKLTDLQGVLSEVGEALNLDGLKAEQAALIEQQHAEGFWNDIKNAQVVNQKLKATENKINGYNRLATRIEEAVLLVEMSLEAGDAAEAEFVAHEIASLEKEIDELRLATLLKGKYDFNNAILTLHAGAGGTEAQDWANMLYRMYSRYLDRSGYKSAVIDSLAGDEAGLKSITFTAEGDNAYGYLKAEMGVHRLVRISPFDSNSRRHTSFASLEVMPEIEDDKEIEILTEDLKIDTYRAGGAGGQHVNKTESAVRITHMPTGIVVQCQNERSQIQNREVCMRMLRSKLIEKKERERLEQEQSFKGDMKKIEWGSQIRSYVFCPYTMVKDHRTGYETGNVDAVMDGEIEGFITSYLKALG